MDLPTLIILSIVCVAIGFMLDNLLRSMRGAEKDKSAPLSSLPAEEHGPPSEIVTDSEEKLKMPTAPGSNLIQLLRVWRDPNRPGIILEVGGTRAQSSAELDSGQLDQVSEALHLLQAWLHQGARRPTPSQDEQLVSETLTSVLVEAEPGTESPPKKTTRPSLNPIQIVANALRAEVRKPPDIADQSLATQVDLVLQEKIIGTPLENRGIRLLDAPDQGLLVQVGIEKYHGVEEVPEAEIREIIREAVAEWGRRTSLEKKGHV